VKKALVFLFMVFISLFLCAQENFDNFDSYVSNIQEPETLETMENMETMENNEEPEEPAGFRFKNRTVELSIANISVDVSNNFISASDVFKNPFYLLLHTKEIRQDPVFIYRDDIVIDINDFFNGFKFNFNAAVKPFSFNFNRNDNWGFGLDIGHINAVGNVYISGNLMHLGGADNEKVDVGAAVFADVGIPVFFHVNEYKIRIRPAVYMPILYSKPNITYNKRNIGEGTYVETVYDMRVYSIVDMDDDIMQGLKDNARDIPMDLLGYDFELSVEYPLDYDLDAGVHIVNIPVPFTAAKLHYYSQINGSAFIDTSDIDLSDLVNDEEGLKNALENAWDYEYKSGYGYDSDGKKIYRPFSMLFYLNYRPFNTGILSLIPSLGFSLNRLYNKVFSFEGGLSARFDFANIFIPVIGINYNDRKWKNNIDLAFNLRILEIDFGFSMQSYDLIKSFQGAGLGVNFGVKLGW